MFYSEDIIEQVRTENDIVEVIGDYVKLQKKGSSYFGLCPFHNEKSPSFSVSPNKQMYYCFGCGEGGNVISFLMKYENYTFIEAMEVLANRAGVELPKMEYSKEQRREKDLKTKIIEINTEAAKYFHYLLKSDRGKLAYNYLKGSQLSDEIIVKFGLGYSDKYSNNLYMYLKKKGYNALLDYNDKEYSSYHAKRPMIVFDTDSVKLQSVSETNPKIVSQMYKKYNAERIAKETVANTLGLITKMGNKTISECSSYVELKTKDYLK